MSVYGAFIKKQLVRGRTSEQIKERLANKELAEYLLGGKA